VNQPSPDAVEAVAPVVEALERLNVPYHIGGSLASSAHGIPRATVDVDVIAELEVDHVDWFVDQLAADYYVNRESMLEAIERRTSFNLVHYSTMLKVDIFVPGTDQFAEQEQRRARAQTFGPAESTRTFVVKSPEDLVLRKLSWYKLGGEVSQQQWNDVLGILTLQRSQLDHDYLINWAAELGVTDLLQRAWIEASDT